MAVPLRSELRHRDRASVVSVRRHDEHRGRDPEALENGQGETDAPECIVERDMEHTPAPFDRLAGGHRAKAAAEDAAQVQIEDPGCDAELVRPVV
jgi:hypothetical protein